MPATPIIRDATIDDVHRLGFVHHAAWLATYTGIMDAKFLDPLTPGTFEQYAKARLGPGVAVKAGEPYLVCELVDERGGGIVGFARAGPTRDKSPTGDPVPDGFASRWDSELYAIYLLKQHWGTGLGRVLMSEVVQRLRGAGSRSMCVWVLTGNGVGRAFYERLGGTLVGEGVITLEGTTYPQVAYGWRELPRI